MRTEELRRLSRDQLVEHASTLGISRPRTLTQAELVDEIVRRSTPGHRQRRGWLGRARDLVATVVERGLHLPEAASLLRSTQVRRSPAPPPPLPTVTLAEIYAAQGYHSKAVSVLDEVVRREPDHREAKSLRERFLAKLSTGELDERSERASGPNGAGASNGSPHPSGQSAPSDRAAGAAGETPSHAPAAAPEDAGPGGDDLGSTAAVSGPGRPGYDVDDVVALATDAETAFAYWEVRPLSFARVQKRHPKGRLVVRVLATRPNERGAVSTSTRDVPVDELVGDVFLRGLPPGGEVRIAIGWKWDGEIIPLAVAPELRMPHRFGDDRPGIHSSAPAPEAAPDPKAVRAEEPQYQRLLGRAAPLTWVDLGGVDLGGAPATAEAVRHAAVEHEEITQIERWVGGASDLYRVLEEQRRRQRSEVGGASDLAYGGASDLQTARPLALH